GVGGGIGNGHPGGSGGGVCYAGRSDVVQTGQGEDIDQLIVTDSTILGNAASRGGGDGVGHWAEGGRGGGMFVDAVPSAATTLKPLVIQRSTIAANKAGLSGPDANNRGGGGGIYAN